MDALELRPYQVEGAEWLAKREAAILADVPRAGKSRQVLKASDLVSTKALIVIVCPSFVTLPWAEEVAKVTSRQAFICYGRKGDRFRAYDPREADPETRPKRRKFLKGAGLARHTIGRASTVLIVPYDCLIPHREILDNGREKIRRDLPGWSTLVCTLLDDARDRGDPTIVVFDEGHYLRGRTSARHEHALMVSEAADHRWAVTATPIVAYRRDLFGLLAALRLRSLPSVWDFDRRFCGGESRAWGDPTGEGKSGRAWWNQGKSNDAELKAWSRAWMLRRGMDVIGLYLPKKARRRLIGDSSSVVDSVTETLMAGGKAIVFTKLKATAEEITRRLEGLARKPEGRRTRLGVWQLTGNVDPETRAVMASEFRGHKGAGVVVATIESMGGGVSLLGASTVDFAELGYTAGSMVQAENRAYAPGAPPILVTYWAPDEDDRASEILVRSAAQLDLTDDDDAAEYVRTLEREYQSALGRISMNGTEDHLD